MPKLRHAVLGCAMGAVALGAASCTNGKQDTMQDQQATSLQSQLDERRADSADRVPEEKRNIMQNAITDLRESDLVENAAHEGEKAPAFTLPNAHGESVQLASLLKEGPVVIVFYRGGWCPYCNIQLQAMQQALPQIQAQGAQLVAISPETPDETEATTTANDLTFHVLSDRGGKVADQFRINFEVEPELNEVYRGFKIDLQKSNGTEETRLPLAATFVVDTDRTIRYAFLDEDYTKRAEPSEVIEVLERINK